MLHDLLISALLAVSALFFVVDPIGLVPIFVALTGGYSKQKRQATARKATLIFVVVVSFFAIAGGVIFRVLGVSLAAFKIAGGGLLLLTALDMLRGMEPMERTSDEELDEAAQKHDVAVVPLAMPLLAGPGAIATVMVLTSRASHVGEIAVVLFAVAFTGVASYWILGASAVVAKVLGKGGRSILERVMGLILAAIAVQFVVDGLAEAFPGIAESIFPPGAPDHDRPPPAAWMDP